MASNNTIWYKKVLGDELIHCEALSNENLSACEKNLVPVEVLFEKYGSGNKLIIGLYFLPIESSSDECTNYLIQLYHLVNYTNEKCPNSNFSERKAKGEGSNTFLQVVQVLLRKSVNWLDRCTVDESKVYGHLKDLPWYAVSVRDRDRVIKLTRRYQIKSLTPSLILLDGETGEIITNHGRERLLEDPMGLNFPWKPRKLHAILTTVGLVPGGSRDGRQSSDFQRVQASILGFYFSANWCPPCRGFTPLLTTTYNRLKMRGVNFEVIFVSSDRTSESYEVYLSGMPWLAIPYREEDVRRELESLFRVQGIPTLVIVDTDGSVITYDGRYEITDDPEGELFPWRPRLVNILTPRQAAKLQDTPSVVLFIEGDESEMEFAENVLAPAAKSCVDGCDLNEDRSLEFFIACDSDSSDTLREFIGIDDAVPLLTLINIPEGTWTVLEDEKILVDLRQGGGARAWSRRVALELTITLLRPSAEIAGVGPRDSANGNSPATSPSRHLKHSSVELPFGRGGHGPTLLLRDYSTWESVNNSKISDRTLHVSEMLCLLLTLEGRAQTVKPIII